MEIQTRRGNRRWHYSIFCKIKIFIIRLIMRSIGRTVNLFMFYFTTMLIQPVFYLSHYLANVLKIIRKWNKIYVTPVLSRNRILGENLFLSTRLKEALKPNCKRILEILKEVEK